MRRLNGFLDLAIRVLPILVGGWALAVATGVVEPAAVLPADAIVPLKNYGYEIGSISAVLPNPCGTALLCPVQSDSNEAPAVSNLVLRENGRPIGPAHSNHEDINLNGHGRYSHWADSLRFSTSDNSDPRTNQRTYTIVARPTSTRIALLGMLLVGVLVVVRQRRGLAAGLPEIRLAVKMFKPALERLSIPSRLVLRMIAPIAVWTGILWAGAIFVASRDADRFLFAKEASVEMNVIKVQDDRAAKAAPSEIAFFGDSSCLMDIDVPRLRDVLPRRSIESYCTIAYVGPAGYALLIDRLVDRGAAPIKLVLAINPIQFERDASWDRWIDIGSADVSSTPDATETLDYMRRKWFDNMFYSPLPDGYGQYYGGAVQLETTIADNHGSAVDPSGALNVKSLQEFLRRAAAWRVPQLEKKVTGTLNDRFRQALVPLAHAIARVGAERSFLLITPVWDKYYDGATAADVAESRRQIAATLGIPPQNIIAADAVLPAPYFSTDAHLNRWGRAVYTDALAGVLGRIF
jgi:hypothetical protein